MSEYSCLICKATFPDQTERENHFRSDWHSYNVKRRVAQLEPLSKDLYEERQKLVESLKNKKKVPVKIYCEICKKSFSSKNAFDQHERSKRHMKGLKQAQEAFQNSPKEEVVEEETITAPSTEKEEFCPEEYEFIPGKCLFCREVSSDIETNLDHMFKKHGLIIPDRESVIDLEGLLDYLGQKISVGCVCISCNHGFKSASAVRAHMFDKGHTRIAYDNEEDFQEFEEFYDYTDVNNESQPVVRLLPTRELQLEDGTIIGNREYNRYYKQTYTPENEKRQAIAKLLLESGREAPVSSKLILYEAKKDLISKHSDVERLNRYAIRERLRAGMNMNKIHLAHFNHRYLCLFSNKYLMKYAD